MPLIEKQQRPLLLATSWGRRDSFKRKIQQGPPTPNSPKPLFGGGRIRFARKRRGEDDERWKKNRKIVDHHVRRLATLVGKDLSVNSEGLAFFPFKKFIIVLEVPADNPALVFIYTMVCRAGPHDQAEVLKLAMQLNYMQNSTRGATLGLDGEEVNLCYSCHIAGLSFNELKGALEDFLLTAVEVNEQLDSVKMHRGSSESERARSYDSV